MVMAVVDNFRHWPVDLGKKMDIYCELGILYFYFSLIADLKMSMLQGSNNYVWSLGDVLGQGATGGVYKGRNKVSSGLKGISSHIIYKFTCVPLSK